MFKVICLPGVSERGDGGEQYRTLNPKIIHLLVSDYWSATG